MSVIAKGADVGYRLFIVLSGITDNLRSQTQERLQEMLVGDLHKNWHLLTDLDADFYRTDNAPNLLSNPEQRLLAVVKKNPYRLRRLAKWLDSAGESTLRNCPILLIDDEADQASIDVGKNGRTSRINGLIRQVLDKPKAAYVAYTATPFANLLIDPLDAYGLYPGDFIVDLPRSPDYFGPERLFGREALHPDEEGTDTTDGLDVIRQVPPGEITSVQPPKGRGAVYDWEPKLAPSLRKAALWFILATAARRTRNIGNRHSSMLIHTSMLAEAHARLAVPLVELRDRLLAELTDGAAPTWSELVDLWEEEAARLPPESGQEAVSWSAVREQVIPVLEDLRVIVDNYRSTDRLAYPRDEEVTAIVIGGNTLSRGLTLEGLVCSYFVRSASAYDTLLQMGRWFGYRRGYSDLVRIWMTGDLESWFFDLATVEQEIRNEIRRYEEGAEHVTPRQLAVKLRDHPAMSITAANKMGVGQTVEISYGKTRQQTILFNHQDPNWLGDNRAAVVSLLRAIADRRAWEGNRDGRPFYIKVASDAIAASHLHERANVMRSDLLTGYLEQQTKQGFLLRWNVVVMAHPDDSNGTLDLGLEAPVNLIQRARLDIPAIAHANIKALVSTIDRVADLPEGVATLHEQAGGTSDELLQKLREDRLGSTGLLCIYPISKDSRPRDVKVVDGQRRRLPLDAVDHVLGIALFFPEARGPAAAHRYVSAVLPEDPDLVDDIEAADNADEIAGEAQDAAGPPA